MKAEVIGRFSLDAKPCLHPSRGEFPPVEPCVCPEILSASVADTPLTITMNNDGLDAASLG
jgi:hypothetical protein